MPYFRYILRRNDRAKVELQKHISGGLGSVVHISYWVYDKLGKDAFQYFRRKDAEEHYRNLVKFNLHLLRRKKENKKKGKKRRKKKRR